MTMTTDGPVISGLAYTVTEIDGHPPTGLAGCLGGCNDNPAPSTTTKPATTTVATEPPKVPDVATPPAATAPPTPAPAKPTTTITKSEPVGKGDDSTEIDDSKIKSIAELISRARQALAIHESDRALELAARIVKKAPLRSGGWNLLGRAQLQAGQRELALVSFEKAVAINPGNSYAQNNLGLTLIYARRYEEAIEALEEAVELEPVEGYMWNNLGMAYEHVDRLDDAREAYEKAAEMENSNARDSLARLKGVKSVIRTAKVDLPPGGGKTDVKTTIEIAPTQATEE